MRIKYIYSVYIISKGDVVMTYMDFIENRIKNYDFGVPIYTSTLTHNMAEEFQLSRKTASAAVSVAINRLINSKEMTELRFFQKGIYYKVKMTPFGETGINKEILIAEKYLSGDNGYETGYALLHRMGLTTQMPAQRVIATNKATSCIRADKALGILICPPKVKINAKNKRYLQVLDAIDTMVKAPVDANRPYHLLAKHIQNNGMDYGELLSIAGKHYNRNTVLTLAQIAGERN